MSWINISVNQKLARVMSTFFTSPPEQIGVEPNEKEKEGNTEPSFWLRNQLMIFYNSTLSIQKHSAPIRP
jgi:hypothetical protein